MTTRQPIGTTYPPLLAYALARMVWWFGLDTKDDAR